MRSQRAKARKAIKLMIMALSRGYPHDYFDNPVIKLFDASLHSFGIHSLNGTESSTEDFCSTLQTFEFIGLLLGARRRFDESLEWYQQALAGEEKMLGANHSSTINTFYNIGAALYCQKRYDEAIEWYKRALAGEEKLLGINHPSTLDAVNSISALFSRQKRYDEAMEWCERALAIQKEAPGTEKSQIQKTILRMILIAPKKNGCGHWRVGVMALGSLSKEW